MAGDELPAGAGPLTSRSGSAGQPGQAGHPGQPGRTGQPGEPGAPGRSLRGLLGLVVLVLFATLVPQLLQRRAPQSLPPGVAAAVRPGDIRMIASVGCVYCGAARTWFNDNRLPFTECLVERDAACAAAYQALRAPGTPILLVRNRRILGFDPKAVAEALADPS